MADKLTEAMIAEGMARAEKAVCGSGHSRCFALPDPLAEARKTCNPKGQCKIGGARRVIVAEAGGRVTTCGSICTLGRGDSGTNGTEAADAAG